MSTTSPQALHLIDKPLSEEDLANQIDNLSDLQGNILKGHGRDHSAHIFLKFKPGRIAMVRAWLHGPLKARITSAQKQIDDAAAFKATQKDGGVFQIFVVSAAGYAYLGKDTAAFGDASFRAGAQASIDPLNDPKIAAWEPGFADEIHAMLLIADVQQAKVAFMAREVAIEVSAFADVLVSQPGDQQKNERGNGIEHFGYVDGRSQPLMLERDLAGESDGRTLWNPMVGPAQVLIHDPFGGADSSGSYFVFRKLEEKVRAFKTQEQVLATAMGLTGDARELAGALVIGRFEDGTPVALSDEPLIEDSLPPNDAAVPNDFDYRHDTDGSRCPFMSHIRKSNPRGSGPGGLVDEMTRHMARRGITYGERAADTFEDISKMPVDGVGLLFMAYQRSIVDQFEFIQTLWVDNAGFPGAGSGMDPVIGQHANPAPTAQVWPKVWGQAGATVSFDFRDFVVMKGGEYFFSPSLSGIAAL